MSFYPLTLALNFWVWKSFQRGSLKIHLVFIEKASVRDGTIDTQRKIGQDRKGKEQEETEIEAGTHRDETAQSSKQKTPKQQQQKTTMLAAVPAGAIWICAPQPLPSKPQQEVMLSALLPGSSTRSRSFYRLQGLRFKLIFHMHPVFFALFAVCFYRSACVCEVDEGLCAIKTVLVCHGGWGWGFLSTDTAALVCSSTDIWVAFHPIYWTRAWWWFWQAHQKRLKKVDAVFVSSTH